MGCDKEDPPSYKDSVSSYVPPPAYSERSVVIHQITANNRTISNINENNNNSTNQEDQEIREMMNSAEALNEFNSIDSFDFQQLDDVLNGVDLSLDVHNSNNTGS